MAIIYLNLLNRLVFVTRREFFLSYKLNFNTVRTKLYLSQLKTQFVPRTKHSVPRL